MTKEEILEDEYRKLIVNWDKPYRQHPSIFKAAYTGMEILAKQQAVAFFRWYKEGVLPDGKCVQYAYKHTDSEIVMEYSPNEKFYTTEELYDIFISQIKIND